jgi:UDP-glucose 4-epimerase
VEEVARREGDPAELVAGNARALQLLGWQPRHNDLAFILRTAWEWEKKLAQRVAPAHVEG